MLGPVVLKHPVDLFHLGDGSHVRQKDAHLEHRFEDDFAPAAQRHQMIQPAYQHRGQHGKEQDGKQAAHHGSRRQQNVLGLFAQMVAHPFFKGGFLGLGVIVVAHAHLCRVHHVAVAHDEALDHRDGAPHERNFCPDAVGRGIFQLGLNGAIRLAHGAADLLGAPHHDAFHQCLPAHTCFKAFLVGSIHGVLL